MQMETVPPAMEEIKPKQGIWGGWPTVGFSAAIFGIFFTAQNLAAIVFMAVQIALNPSLWSINNLMEYLLKLQSNGLMMSTAIIFSGICGFFFIWLFIKLRRGYSLRDYLELKVPAGRQWLMVLGAFIVLFIGGNFADKIYTDSQALQMMTDAYLSAGWTPLFWIATVVFAPIFEESFFRGFLFVGLRDSKAGPVWAVIITSITFAIVHVQYNWTGILVILLIGGVFGLVRLFSKSLWTTIVLHAAWNLLSTISVAMYIRSVG
jgi:membrane protease YdiL (CAAX protease family)